MSGDGDPSPAGWRNRWPDSRALLGWTLAVALPVTTAALGAFVDERNDLRLGALFIMIVAVVGGLFGWGPGLLSAGVGFLLSWLVLMEPAWSFRVNRGTEAWGLVCLAAAASVVLWLVHSLDTARRTEAASATRAGLLLQLAETLGAAVDRDEVASGLVTSVAGSACHWAAVAFLDERSDELQLVHSVGLTPAIEDAWRRTPMSHRAPITDCVRERRPLFFPDRDALLSHYADLPLTAAQTRGRAWAMLPLVDPAGAPHGVVVLGWLTEQPFDVDDRSWFVSVAALASQAMSRVETVELAELEHLGRTLDHMLDAVALLSPVRDADGHIEDFRLKYLNQAARELWGADAEREVGRPLREVAVGLVEAGLIWHCSEVLAHDAPVEIDAFEVGQPGGRHFVFALQIAPFGESVLLVGRDVTERADLDRSLRRSERQLAAAQRLAKIGWWRYDIDRARLEVSDELRVLFGYAPDDTVDTAQMQERTSPEDRARLTDLWERTIASGGSYRTELRMTRVDGSEMRAVAHAEVEEIDDDGTTPKMLWGTLQDVTDEREAQEEAQRQQDAVERLQEAIGPDELPRVAGVALSAAYLPAGIEANVGGDWYDAVALRDGRVALVVADAGGHGLPAVALMTQIRHAARTLLELGGGPGDVLKHLTNLVAAAEGFATALVAFFDPITGVFTWASAGHLPPVAHDRDDAQLLGGEPGIPLGVPTDDPYREHVIHLPVGGSVVLFTDGLVERRDEVIDAGLDRLRKSIDALVQTDDLRADELAASLVASGEHDDDVCVLVMTRA